MASTTDTMTVTTEPNGRSLQIAREFDASPALVYRAMTDRDSIPRWWGARRFATVVEEMDVRVGGRWRFRQLGPEGDVFVFHGEYREIVPGQRVVQTVQLDGAPGEPWVETMTLEDIGGRTLMTMVAEFSSTGARDEMVAGGLVEGMRETYERLDEELASAKR